MNVRAAVLAVLAAAAVGVSGAIAVRAASPHVDGTSSGGCDADAVGGVYALHLTGAAFGGAWMVAGHIDLQRTGRISGTATEVWHGQPQRSAWEGSYAIDDRCLGSATIAAPEGLVLDDVTFDFFPSEDGDRLFVNVTGILPRSVAAPGRPLVGPMTLAGVADRLSRSPMTCETASVRGTFAGLTKGDTAAGPMATVNRPVFDGRGSVVDPFTLVVAGQAERSTYTGTYEIGPECRGTMTLSGEHLDGRDTHAVDLYLSRRGSRLAWIVTHSSLHRFAGVDVDPLGANGRVPGNAGEFNVTISGFWERVVEPAADIGHPADVRGRRVMDARRDRQGDT